MEAIFYRYADKLPPSFDVSCLPAFPAAGTFRESIPAYLTDYLTHEAEKAAEALEAGTGWPVLLASDYLRFSRDGNRVHFERRYFKRRAILTLLTLAEYMEGKGRFIGHIADGVLLLCEESGWQLPAHNSYRRDAPQLPLPDAALPVIDLFAAETAAQLAVIDRLLRDRMDAVSPLLCMRIRAELEKRIIRPFLTCHFWWMGNGDEPMCNWTPWIIQNVLLTAFLTPQSDADRREIIKKAFYGLDCFLKDYGEDGCCSEGVEYYRHAGLCLFNAAEILSAVTGGLTAAVFSLPKIRNIAEYVVNMHVGGDGSGARQFSPWFFNFADCSPAAGMSGCREYRFGKRTGSRRLCDFAARSWKESAVQEKLLGLSAGCESGCNLFYLLQVLESAAELDSYEPESGTTSVATPGTGAEKAAAEGKADGSGCSDSIFYPSVGVSIMNRGAYSLAVKSGGNGDSHNHNDTGSLILYKDGKPLLIDAGVGSYTKQTFSADRYAIWTMQSSYHNLPEIDGLMQEAGAEFRARDVHVSGDSITQDIAPCYPAGCGLASYVRTVSCSDAGVSVRDRAAFTDERPHRIVLNLMLCEKPVIAGNVISAGSGRITFKAIGGQAAAAPGTAEAAIGVEEIAVDDERLRRAWKGSLYRVRIAFSSEIRGIHEIHIEIT